MGANDLWWNEVHRLRVEVDALVRVAGMRGNGALGTKCFLCNQG